MTNIFKVSAGSEGRELQSWRSTAKHYDVSRLNTHINLIVALQLSEVFIHIKSVH
jgi:hypothetical protein